MSSRKRRALVALQLREKGRWVPGKKPGCEGTTTPKKARAGTKPTTKKAGAGKADAGKKRSSPWFQEEVTPKKEVTSDSNDGGPPPGFQGLPPGFQGSPLGNPTPASMKNKGKEKANKGKGKEVIHYLNLLQVSLIQLNSPIFL